MKFIDRSGTIHEIDTIEEQLSDLVKLPPDIIGADQCKRYTITVIREDGTIAVSFPQNTELTEGQALYYLIRFSGHNVSVKEEQTFELRKI